MSLKGHHSMRHHNSECWNHGFHFTQSKILAPTSVNTFSTSLAISFAAFPSASYVECAPLRSTTSKPSLNAPRDVECTQHSLCIPNVTIVPTSLARSSSANCGFEAKVSPSLSDLIRESKTSDYVRTVLPTSLSFSSPSRGGNTSSHA
jgi:hypothetical protein